MTLHYGPGRRDNPSRREMLLPPAFERARWPSCAARRQCAPEARSRRRQAPRTACQNRRDRRQQATVGRLGAGQGRVIFQSCADICSYTAPLELAPRAPWFRMSHVLAKSSESLSISRTSIIRRIIFVEPTGTQVFSRRRSRAVGGGERSAHCRHNTSLPVVSDALLIAADHAANGRDMACYRFALRLL
jgi:hypothetical protein